MYLDSPAPAGKASNYGSNRRVRDGNEPPLIQGLMVSLRMLQGRSPDQNRGNGSPAPSGGGGGRRDANGSPDPSDNGYGGGIGGGGGGANIGGGGGGGGATFSLKWAPFEVYA